MVLMTCVPWLSRFGLGRLPGDINFRVFGRRISIPLASTMLIFLLFYKGVGSVSQTASEQQMENLQQAIRRSTVHCYAVEVAHIDR